MSKFKICVYAICKNEAKFIERWVQTTAPADYIVVLDTGSSDETLQLLKQHAHIHTYSQIIFPWRFDVARNLALALVPNDIDICLSLDMDEVLTPGWYDILQAAWTETASSAICRSVWNFKPDGSENGVFWPNRIHKRHDYVWTHAIHEVLTYHGGGVEDQIKILGLEIHHHPDLTKKRDYLSMLEASVSSHPNDARDLFYLGREYLYHCDYEKSIRTFKHYLTLSNWAEERCSAYCFISKCFLALNKFSEALTTLESALTEIPFIREPYIDLANIYYLQHNWSKTLYYIEQGLMITSSPHGFIAQGYAWDATPYDLACIAHYQLGHLDASLLCAAKCLFFSPYEKRYKDNQTLLQKLMISDICKSLKTIRRHYDFQYP